MAPKISSVLGFQEREQLHKNSSILSYTGDVGQNYLDLNDEQENEQNTFYQSRRRNTGTEKKDATSGLHLTSISLRLTSARTAVASHAKKLYVRESARYAISQLRKTMVKVPSSRPELSPPKEDSSSASTQSDHFDNDHFDNARSQASVEHDGIDNTSYECMCADVNLEGELKFTLSPRGSSAGCKGRLTRLLSSRPWTKTSKQARRLSDELY